MSIQQVDVQDLSDLICVGKVRDAHGLKGELFVIFFSKEASWLDQLKEVCLVKETALQTSAVQAENHKPTNSKVKVPLPRFKFQGPIQRSKAHKIGAIFKVDGVDSRTDAEEWIGSLFYIPRKFLESRPGDHLFLREVMDFEVIHEDDLDKPLGRVVGFSSNGAQDLLVVEPAVGDLQPDSVFEIPFIPNFVIATKMDQKRLIMNFPKELMELASHQR